MTSERYLFTADPGSRHVKGVVRRVYAEDRMNTLLDIIKEDDKLTHLEIKDRFHSASPVASLDEIDKLR